MAKGVRGRPRHADVLTPAEWRILQFARHGLSRQQIASRDKVSAYAVRYHLRNIKRKLSIASLAEMRSWVGYPAGSSLATKNGENDVVSREIGITNVGQIALLVRDVQRASAFYGETLGLPHLFAFGPVTFFDCGGTRLFIREVPDAEWRAGLLVYFRVADIDSSFRALVERGVEFEGAPHLIHTHDDGLEEWMAFFTDPDGNQLALMSKVMRA